MTSKQKQLLIESSEFTSKIKLNKKLKESVKLSSGQNGTLIVRNIPVTILNRKNQNGRIYSTAVVQEAIDAAKPQIESKQLLSQACEHPEASYVSPTTASHVIIGAYIKHGVNLVVEGQKGKFDVLFNDWEVLNTDEGKNLRALFEAECSIGTSIRGVGDLNGENVIDYEFLGCDCVGNPSSSTFTRMPVSESVKVEVDDREPLTENFMVTTASTNVVNNLDKAATIQAQLDHATYGTVVKTSTKLDNEVDPKTGATTSITTLEAETEDEVANLDQALAMAKRAMMNGLVNVDSVTIENITNPDKKEAAPEYVPEDGMPMEEGGDEADPVVVTRDLFARFEKGMHFLQEVIDKYENGELAKTDPFCDTNYDELKFVLAALKDNANPNVVGNEQAAAALAEYEAWYEEKLVNPFRKELGLDKADDITDTALQDSCCKKEVVTEAKKEKDPKEGRQFVLRTPNGYVSMEGNALVFKEDPTQALHFIVGKEESGLVHLSGVEKILDTMGVYDVQKYYKNPVTDISTDETKTEANILDGTPAHPIQGQEQVNATLGEGNTRYIAEIQTQGEDMDSDVETIPVSAIDPQSILAEVGNLWQQKAKGDNPNLSITLVDTQTNDRIMYDPKMNALVPLKNQGVTEAEDAGIEQDDNKLTMKLDPENPEGAEVEKEFDTKAQADVAKAGIEQGKIDGSILLNEKDGITPGWYIGIPNIGVSGPYKTKEEAWNGLEDYSDIVTVEYLGEEKQDMEEAGSGAAVGAALGLPLGPMGALAGGALGSFAQDAFSTKKNKKPGWKAGAILGGLGGSLVGLPGAGALLGGGLQHALTSGDDGLQNAFKATGNAVKKGWNSFTGGVKKGYNMLNQPQTTTQAAQAVQATPATTVTNNAAAPNIIAQTNNGEEQAVQDAQVQANNGEVYQQDPDTTADAAQANSGEQQAVDQGQVPTIDAATEARISQLEANLFETNKAVQVLENFVSSALQQFQAAQQQFQAQAQAAQQAQVQQAQKQAKAATKTAPKASQNRVRQTSSKLAGNKKEAVVDEKLYTNASTPSDPVVDQPLDETLGRDIVVSLANIDWDIESLVSGSSDSDWNDDMDLQLSPEEYAMQADDSLDQMDLYSTIENLPEKLTIQLQDVDLPNSASKEEIKQAIIDAANAQTQYKINDADIVAIH